MAQDTAELNDRIRPYYRPLYNRLRSWLLLDGGGDWRKSVILSSGGRTGSTWVSEIINFDHAYRYMFEPVSLRRLLLTPRYMALMPGGETGDVFATDSRLQYIRPGDDDPVLLERITDVVTGRYRNPEVDQYNYTLRIAFDRRLIKETQSNLWMRWLYGHFPGIPIVWLLRHPIPTVRSRLYGKPDTDPVKRRADFRKLVLGQPELVRDHLEPFRNALENAESIYEQRFAVWCIQNYVPLQQFGAGEIHVAFYEKFCVEPEAEVRRLHAFLGRPQDDATIARVTRVIGEPSSTYHAKGDGATRIQGLAQVSGWMSKATSEETSQASAMLRAFGLDAVYTPDDPMPKRDGASLLRTR